jgi:hypothetical protein
MARIRTVVHQSIAGGDGIPKSIVGEREWQAVCFRCGGGERRLYDEYGDEKRKDDKEPQSATVCRISHGMILPRNVA